MNDSHISYDKKGNAVAFVGEDAIRVYRYAMLASHLRLFASCGMIPTRGVSGRKMLDVASQLTGKTYRRGDALKAADDVSLWVRTMKAALPSEDLGG